MFDGVTGQPLTAEEAARRKKAATSYDGNLPEGVQPGRAPGGVGAGAGAGGMGAPGQGVNVEEQIRNIHMKFAERK